MSMELIITNSPSTFTKNPSIFSIKPPKTPSQIPSPSSISFPVKPIKKSYLSSRFPISCSSSPRIEATYSASSLPPTSDETSSGNHQRNWMVLVENPSKKVTSREQIIDYYVKTLEKVLGSEKFAQRSLYDASCPANFGFCCQIDPQAAQELANSPGIISVMPDPDFDSFDKDYGRTKIHLDNSSISFSDTSLLFPIGTSRYWLVRVEDPPDGVISRADVVDYYVQILIKVFRNLKDAQACIYDVSLQSSYGFCCELDDDCAQELAAVPGVLSVELDENFDSTDKDYGGEKVSNKATDIKTKKLFVTGLSFYTSEKTLRAAFEGFGELVEVKIIMDKVSKRSKGYAFIEYPTEDAAAKALKQMNGTIINGWMITVDVARKNPPKYSRGRPT